MLKNEIDMADDSAAVIITADGRVSIVLPAADTTEGNENVSTPSLIAVVLAHIVSEEPEIMEEMYGKVFDNLT